VRPRPAGSTAAHCNGFAGIFGVSGAAMYACPFAHQTRLLCRGVGRFRPPADVAPDSAEFRPRLR